MIKVDIAAPFTNDEESRFVLNKKDKSQALRCVHTQLPTWTKEDCYLRELYEKGCNLALPIVLIPLCSWNVLSTLFFSKRRPSSSAGYSSMLAFSVVANSICSHFSSFLSPRSALPINFATPVSGSYPRVNLIKIYSPISQDLKWVQWWHRGVLDFIKCLAYFASFFRSHFLRHRFWRLSLWTCPEILDRSRGTFSSSYLPNNDYVQCVSTLSVLKFRGTVICQHHRKRRKAPWDIGVVVSHVFCLPSLWSHPYFALEIFSLWTLSWKNQMMMACLFQIIHSIWYPLHLLRSVP